MGRKREKKRAFRFCRAHGVPWKEAVKIATRVAYAGGEMSKAMSEMIQDHSDIIEHAGIKVYSEGNFRADYYESGYTGVTTTFVFPDGTKVKHYC